MTSDQKPIDKRLQAAMENADLGYYVWDLIEDRCIFCTEKLAEIHGMSSEEYISHAMTIEEDAVFVHPDDRAKYLAAFSDHLDRGKTLSVEYRIVRLDGTVRHVREIETVTKFEDGVAIRAEGTVQDLTAAVEMEEKLRQAQKLEAIGNLTGGIAHDFNNILAVILGSLEMLRDATPGDPRTEVIDSAIEAGRRGADLTRKMLSFARQASLTPRTLDLNVLVQDTRQWAARVLPANIRVETSLCGDLWPVRIDPNSAESALLNLILNARDAMPGGGNLRLQTSNVRIPPDGGAGADEGVAPGRYVVLSISDNGEGIPEEKLPRIFDPFYTTKLPGEGSGLGLSMIEGFMNQSGGEVRVSSVVGGGTTFRLYFRASDKPRALPEKTLRNTRRVTTSGARVCLVEDEPALLNILSRILRDSGYTVHTACCADEALKSLDNGEICDVLVTDVVMPGKLSGPQLAARLRETNPSLPVVFMSGYTREAVESGNGMLPEDRRLMKPVDRVTLIRAVEGALSGTLHE